MGELWSPFVVLVVILLTTSYAPTSQAVSIYGGGPPGYSLATHVTTNTFLFTNKNFGFDYPFAKPSRFALAPRKFFLPYQQNIVSTLQPVPTSILPNNDILSLEDNFPKLTEVNENHHLPSPAVPTSANFLATDQPREHRKPLRQRVTYTVPISAVTTSKPFSVGNIGVSTLHDTVLQTTPLPSNDISDINFSTTPKQELDFDFAPPRSSFIEIKSQNGVITPKLNQQHPVANIPQTNLGATPPIENRQSFNPGTIEQAIPFLPAKQNAQNFQQPSVSVPFAGNNRFNAPVAPQNFNEQLPPASQFFSGPQNFDLKNNQFPGLRPAPQFHSGQDFFAAHNRFGLPKESQPQNQPSAPHFPPQTQNQSPTPHFPPHNQPPPPHFPQNFFPGGPGGPQPGQEPENGYNPFHQHEHFPEPPYESEFSSESPLANAGNTDVGQSSGGSSSPPPPLNFEQQTLRKIKTDELLGVTQRKQVPPDCVYNTISYGANGEDCINVKKR